MNSTLVEALQWWAIDRKDEAAIVTRNDSVTYGELYQWAEASCEWLKSLGVQPGDCVTILAKNSLEWCVLSQGILLAGGILAPINSLFTASEVSHMVGRYESKFIFYDDSCEQVANEVVAQAGTVSAININEVSEYRNVVAEKIDYQSIKPDNDVVIIATSGSTGRPKGVVYSHRTILSYASQYALADAHAVLYPRVMVFAPMSTSAGYVVTTQHLIYGGTVYIDGPFDAQNALNRIVNDKITTMMGVPFFYANIAMLDDFEAADVSSIIMANVGGAQVTRELLDTWLNKGVLLRQLYGQTECGGQGTINTRAASLSNPDRCGRGNMFTRIMIQGEDGKECPVNTMGEILIKGPANMVRYWGDPEATQKTIVDGWLHTGDLGEVDENGLLIMIDRLKDIIISGGVNISAAELERVIMEHPPVDEVAVISVKNDKYGETPLAIIYSASDVNATELMDHCKNELSSFKLPRYIVIEDEPLPRLATQKISKVILREKYADAHLNLTPVR